MRPTVGVYLEGELVVWPREDVALVREEALGRLEVTSSRGEVGHRPGPLATVVGAPWVEVSPGVWVHPRHAGVEGDQLRLPGDWTFPGRLASAVPEPDDPEIPELGCRRSEVVSAQRSAWRTDRGPVPSELDPSGCPWMAWIGGSWVNLLRVDRVERDSGSWRVVLRSAEAIRNGQRGFASLCGALGLGTADPAHGSSAVAAMYRLGLRDWPDELLYCEAEVLRERFGTDAQRAIQHVIWQAARLRARGEGGIYGQDIRGFYYSPVEPVLRRLEVPLPAAAEADAWGLDEEPTGVDEGLYPLYVRLLGKIVGDLRLLTFRDLAFHDPRPDMRRLGSQRPWVLVLAEKSSLRGDAFLLAERYGVSVAVLGGYPSLLGTEMLVAALREVVGDREIELLTFVDWDVDGWNVWKALVGQMARYDTRCRILGHLVRPERFTEWELQNLASPIPVEGPMREEKAREWLEETGGIHGRLLGIHADHLRPVERLYRAFEEEVPGSTAAWLTFPTLVGVESRQVRLPVPGCTTRDAPDRRSSTMDEIRKNLERVETRMVASLAAVEGNLAAQGAALEHLAEGQKGLVEAVGRLDRAVNELHRSAGNLRSSFSEYRQHSDEMFSHLKAAVFVMESSSEMRFQRIEARLDDLERRPPAA